MTGEELIRYYNFLVSLMVSGKFRPSYGRRGGFLHFTAQRIAGAVEFLGWLEERHFHPQLYLAGAFGAHNWCYQPKFDMLRQDRYQTAYRDGTASKWWELVRRNEEVRKPPAPVRRGQEIIKLRWLTSDKPEMCRALREATGGYNPASDHCQGCRLRKDCESDG